MLARKRFNQAFPSGEGGQDIFKVKLNDIDR